MQESQSEELPWKNLQPILGSCEKNPNALKDPFAYSLIAWEK